MIRPALRPLVASAAAAAALVASPASAKAPKRPAAPAIPTLPVAFAVAVDEGKPVCDEATVAAQLDEAKRLFSTIAIPLESAGTRLLPEGLAALETRADRDALAAHLSPGVVNAMIVRSLRDVDDPSRLRMGVHWRPARDIEKRYVIIVCGAAPSVLAHELGHFFGNPHSFIEDNVMSYKRSGKKVFFDASQGKRSRKRARELLEAKVIAPAKP